MEAHVTLYKHSLCLQKQRFHTKWQYLYIESICNDPVVLEQNYRYKMMYSPDYKDVNTDEASAICVFHDPKATTALLIPTVVHCMWSYD